MFLWKYGFRKSLCRAVIQLSAHISFCVVLDTSQLEIFCKKSSEVLCLQKYGIMSDWRNWQINICLFLQIEIFENLESEIATDFCRTFFVDFLQKISSWATIIRATRDRSVHHDHLQTADRAKSALVLIIMPLSTHGCTLSSQIVMVHGSTVCSLESIS